MPDVIKAIVFDMDGVLIDAKDWHYDALNKALNHFGYNISRYDHLITYDGLPTRVKLQMLSREQGLPSKLHEFLNELKQVYTMQIVHNRCNPVFQHEYALSHLKSSGYCLGLASNSIRSSIELMMTKSNLMQYLDVVMSNEDVLQGKPHPDIYIKTFLELKVSPREVLVVEDNENGIAAATNAGAHLMIVKDPSEVTLDNITKHITLAEKEGK